MKKAAFFIMIIIFSLPLILRAEEIALTLDEAVSIALRDNPDILLKVEDIKKAKAKLAEERAGLFPTLTVSGGLKNTRGFYDKDIPEADIGVSLKWYLYRGGMVVNTIKSSQFGIDVSQAILDKTRLDTVYSVQKTFYTLLLANEFAKLNKEILDNSKMHLEHIEARYSSGQSSESDILGIKSSLSNVEEAYTASLNQIEASSALLKNLLHLDENVDLKAQGKFDYEPKEVAYDEAILKAMRERPEIRQYEAQEKQAKSGIEIAKSQGRPTIFASWDYYSSSRQTADYSIHPVKGWEDYNVLGITFSWPIFDGWLTKAKVDQAIVDLKEAGILKDKVKRDIALELKDAYLALRDAVAKIKSAESELVLYTDTLSVGQEKFKAGIASSLDLDDITLGFDVAGFNQKQAIYDYISAKNNFERATGG